MSISTIIIGKNKEKVEEKILSIIDDSKFSLKNSPDFLEIIKASNKKSIGIDEVKSLNSFIKILPISHTQKVVLIKEAGILTPEAQNSLLKVLEEPPEYSRIILTAESREKFLPTIISRCQIFEFKDEKNELNTQTSNFLELDLSGRFDWAESTSKLEKAEIVQVLSQILGSLKNSKQDINRVNLLLGVIENISKYNLNTRLALEYLSLNFEKEDNKI